MLYGTTKLQFFCNNKDKIPLLNKSYVVYHFNCRGFCAIYVGKTKRILQERCIEHAWKDKNSAIRAHIDKCEGIIHMKNLLFMNTSVNGDITTPNHRDININIIMNNVQIIDCHRNWNVLLYKETLKVKELKPLLNNRLKN